MEGSRRRRLVARSRILSRDVRPVFNQVEEATGDALGLRPAKGLMLNSMGEAISPGAAWQRTALMPRKPTTQKARRSRRDRRPFCYFDCLPDDCLPRERCRHRIIVLLAAIFI